MNKKPENDIELRSPEVQEVIGNVPNAIIRSGITVIFGIMLLLLAVSWFIKYPDLLHAKVVITTSPAPVTLVCRSSGSLALLKTENAQVASGELIGYLKSNTDLQSVVKLENLIARGDYSSGYNAFGSLGDLETPWSDLLKAEELYSLFLRNNSYQKQIAQLNQQRISYQRLSQTQRNQQKMMNQEVLLIKEKFKTDSILFSQKVLSAIDFNQSKVNWLQQVRNAKVIETSIITSEIEINQIDKQISDLKIKEIEDTQRLELDIKSASNKLKASIAKWKENYLFISPMNGRLAFLSFLENELFLETGKSYFSIIPDHGEIIARAELPIRGSGKVKEGQTVNIQLENYPFEQFGMLKGKVMSISKIPGNDNYRITIELPQQLVTTLGKSLNFNQQLSGNTEIITEDMRLLDRFFFQFRGLVKR